MLNISNAIRANVHFDHSFPRISLGGSFGKSTRFDDRGTLTANNIALIFQGQESVVQVPIHAVRFLRLYSSSRALWKSWLSRLELIFINGAFIFFVLELLVPRYLASEWTIGDLVVATLLSLAVIAIVESAIGWAINQTSGSIIYIKYTLGSQEKACSLAMVNEPDKMIGFGIDREKTLKLFSQLTNLLAKAQQDTISAYKQL